MAMRTMLGEAFVIQLQADYREGPAVEFSLKTDFRRHKFRGRSGTTANTARMEGVFGEEKHRLRGALIGVSGGS
jgi:hypothetical protein